MRPRGPFERLVDDFVFGTLALSPAAATSFGYHVHHGASLDDVLDDFSPAGLAASGDLLHEMDARIAKLDTASLDAEQRADIDIMRNAIGAARLDLEEIQSYRHNPTTYVELLGNALYTPYVLQYAPIGERYRHIINRLSKVPELIRQAEANLAGLAGDMEPGGARGERGQCQSHRHHAAGGLSGGCAHAL
jgi:uncharacterized protein (DUF885 family)